MGGRVPLGYEKDERTLRINEAEAETVPDALCAVPEARNAPAGEGRGGPSETAHQATLRRGWNPDRRAAVSSRTPPLPADQSSLRPAASSTRGVSTRASIHRSLLRSSGNAVPGAAAGRGCQTKETHDEGPGRPFPTGRQALRRDRGPADAEPHQKEKRATAPLLRLPAPHPAQWPKGTSPAGDCPPRCWNRPSCISSDSMWMPRPSRPR